MPDFIACFKSLFCCCCTQVQEYREDEVNAAVGALGAYMNGGQNPVIRLYVDSGGGRGHQVAAVRMLDRIVAPADGAVPGLAYTGDNKLAQLVYSNAHVDTAAKLRQALGWGADQNEGLYKGLFCRLIALDAIGELGDVNLGFSGA